MFCAGDEHTLELERNTLKHIQTLDVETEHVQTVVPERNAFKLQSHTHTHS